MKFIKLNRMYLISTVFMTLTLGACASSELRVESNPIGAKVSVEDNAKNPKVIGQTPLVLNAANFPELFKTGAEITISKEGYRPQMVFLPVSRVSASGELKVNLKADEANAVNETAEQVAHAQQLLFKKDLPEAERVLRELTLNKPSIAIFHSLLGNVYYLKKDLSKALQSYERALALEPQNLDIEKMVKKIKNTQPEGVVN